MVFASLNVSPIRAFGAEVQCREVIDFFVDSPSVRLVAIVDEQDRPIASISRTKIIVKAASQFGRALYDKQPITAFVDPPRFVVTGSQQIAQIACQLAGDEVTAAPDGHIPVGEDGTYMGVIDGLDVLRAVLAQNLKLISNLSDEIRIRRDAELEAQRLANTDALTGLNNRRVFIEAAEMLVENGQEAVLLYLDLDRFKFLNDKYGHAVGDDALRVTAERIKSWHPAAMVARLGGDEFGLIIPGAKLDAQIEAALHELHGKVCAPFVSKPGAVNVGASIGAASFPADALSRAEWFHAADKAMQRAKQDKGGIRTYDSHVDLAQSKQVRLKDALCVAVSQNQIHAHFQPFVNVATGEVEGYEVLARWFGPEVGFTPSPAEFVPLAERFGLIDEMFWNVTDQAMKAFAKADPRLKMALNVSPIQFSNLLFPARLAAMASRHGMKFDQIEIEITETAMFRDMAHTVDVLRHLSDMGVSIALDDFGTGYSSLTLVKELPLTKLKIDKSFVQSSTWSPSAEKIVAAAIGLSSALGVKCCAEGVESLPILSKLRELKCETAQGYLFGRPSLSLEAPARIGLKVIG